MKLIQGLAITAFSISIVACGETTAPQEETNTTTQETVVYENKPTTVVPDAAGVLDLNAENGAGVGPGIKYMPEWRAFGWFGNTDKVEWDIAVKEAGNYKAVLEWSVSDEEAGKEFVLEAGSEKIVGIVEKSGSWETFEASEIGTIKLGTGSQKITFKPNKDFGASGALLDLRFIKLTPAK